MKAKPLSIIAGVIFAIVTIVAIVTLNEYKQHVDPPLFRKQYTCPAVVQALLLIISCGILAFALLRGKADGIFLLALLFFATTPLMNPLLTKIFSKHFHLGCGIPIIESIEHGYPFVRDLFLGFLASGLSIAILLGNEISALNGAAKTLKKLWFVPTILILLSSNGILFFMHVFRSTRFILATLPAIAYALALKVAVSNEE